MMKKSAMILTALLAVMMLFTSCDEEKANPVQAEERAVVTISANIGKDERTILPLEFKKPDYFKITLTPHEIPGQTDPVSIQTKDGALSVSLSVKPGKWDVAIEGWNKYESGDILTMTGVQNAQILVANKPNVITVQMNALYNAPGIVEVTFSWTEDALKGSNPLTDALAIKEPSFKVSMRDMNAAEESRITIEDANAVYSPSEKTVKATFPNIPATTNGRFFFELKDKNGNVVKKTGVVAVQVTAGQVSKPDTASIDSFTMVEPPNYASSIKVQRKAYTLNEALPGTAVDLHLKLKGGVDYLNAMLIDESTGAQVGSTQKLTITPDQPITVTGLVSGKSYTIKLQAHYKNGMMSAMDTFPELTGVKSWVPVESIEIVSAPEAKYILGSTFDLAVKVLPEDATIKTYTWSIDGTGITNEGDTFTAASLGSANITVTSNDMNDIPVTASTGMISSVLDSPANLQTKLGASSISISWNKVASAEGYELYKKTDNGAFEPLSLSLGANDLTYEDKNLLAGKEYTYQVIAKAASKVTESYDPTSLASVSMPVTSGASSITIVMPSSPSVLPKITATGAVVTPDTDLTITLQNEIPGATDYEWLVDGKRVSKGTFAQTSSITIKYNQLDLESGMTTHSADLLITVNGMLYSTSFEFKHPETDITIESAEGRRVPNTLIYENKESIAKIDAYTDSNTDKTLTYYSNTPEIAGVSADGYLEPVRGAHGTARIIVRDKYGATKETTFEVYDAQFADAKALLEAVNKELYTLMMNAGANTYDWYVWDAMTTPKTDITFRPYSHVPIREIAVFVSKHELADFAGVFMKGNLGGWTGDGPVAQKGGSRLQFLGSPDKGQDNIMHITLPGGQGGATIKYNDVNIDPNADISKKSYSTKNYTVKFDFDAGSFESGQYKILAGHEYKFSNLKNPETKSYDIENRIEIYK